MDKDIIETIRVDNCECIYCHHIFDGRDATDSDLDKSIIECPKCGREMAVFMSVEYMCCPVEVSDGNQ